MPRSRTNSKPKPKPKLKPQPQAAPSKPDGSLASFLFLLRAVVAGLFVRSCGVLLKATEGVFGPRVAGIASGVCVATALVVGNALSKQSANLVASLAAAACIALDAAALRKAAAVVAALCFALPAPHTGRASSYTAFVVYTILSVVVPLPYTLPIPDHITAQVHSMLPSALLMLAISAHTTAARRVQRRAARRSFARTVVVCGIALGTCVLTLPEVGHLYAARVSVLPSEYVLVAQAMGATGRVSVLNDKARSARFLLADHSILGGRYTSEQYAAETVFAQFHVHEAVRLTRKADGKDDPGRGRALCIGLGGGIVAQALHDHGCTVDAVEVDGAVARFAAEHFGLRGPHVVVADAAGWLRTAPAAAYDYAVHDVFTGGRVHAPLFSVATLRLVRRTLRPDGVLALNFVGAPTGKAALAVSAVRARLRAVWTHVAMFGEDTNSSVANFVFFASDVPQRLTFRPARTEDALGSQIRAATLKSLPKLRMADADIPELLLEDATDGTLNNGQWITAKSHWKAMRTILPAKVWHALAAVKHRHPAVAYKRRRRRRRR